MIRETQQGTMIICARRGQRLGPARKQSRQWKQGDRVIVSVSGLDMPGVVLETRASPYQGVQNCKVRVATWNPLGVRWLVSDLKDWVLGTRLVARDGDFVLGLDNQERTGES